MDRQEPEFKRYVGYDKLEIVDSETFEAALWPTAAHEVVAIHGGQLVKVPLDHGETPRVMSVGGKTYVKISDRKPNGVLPYFAQVRVMEGEKIG